MPAQNPASLFSSITIGAITLPNRIAVSPMCEYSCNDGFANDWHLVHLGSRAVGGAGLVFTEATAVIPEGRITPAAISASGTTTTSPRSPRITKFIHAQGARAGIQLAHAGRKASTVVPGTAKASRSCRRRRLATSVAPSAIAFADNYPLPHALDRAGIDAIIRAFAPPRTAPIAPASTSSKSTPPTAISSTSSFPRSQPPHR